MSLSKLSAGLPGAPRCSEAATGNSTRTADTAAANTANDEAPAASLPERAAAAPAWVRPALPVFTDANLFQVLWSKAQDRCSPQERAWLCSGARDLASRLAFNGQEVATSLGLLTEADGRQSGGVGAMQSAPEVSAALQHFGAVFDHIHGLLEIADLSEVHA